MKMNDYNKNPLFTDTTLNEEALKVRLSQQKTIIFKK